MSLLSSAQAEEALTHLTHQFAPLVSTQIGSHIHVEMAWQEPSGQTLDVLDLILFEGIKQD
jgi:hypothetical protein